MAARFWRLEVKYDPKLKDSTLLPRGRMEGWRLGSHSWLFWRADAQGASLLIAYLGTAAGKQARLILIYNITFEKDRPAAFLPLAISFGLLIERMQALR